MGVNGARFCRCIGYSSARSFHFKSILAFHISNLQHKTCVTPHHCWDHYLSMNRVCSPNSNMLAISWWETLWILIAEFDSTLGVLNMGRTSEYTCWVLYGSLLLLKITLEFHFPKQGHLFHIFHFSFLAHSGETTIRCSILIQDLCDFGPLLKSSVSMSRVCSSNSNMLAICLWKTVWIAEKKTLLCA